MVRPILLGVVLLTALATSDAVAAPPGTEINSYHPLFLFEAPGETAFDDASHFQDIFGAWNSLPDAIRPYAVLNLRVAGNDPALWQSRFDMLLPQLQDAAIPVSLTIATGESGATYPWEGLRTILGTYSVVRGLHVEGLEFTTYPAHGNLDPTLIPGHMRWLMGTIEIASQSGRFITLQLPDLNLPRMMANTWAEQLYQVLRNYPANVIPLTDPHGPHRLAQQASAMGLWLEGAVGNWGQSLGSSWYREAHLVEPGVFGPTPDARMPLALYRAMGLMGALSGATVYRFEDVDDLWAGQSSYAWDETIEPMLTEIVGDALIARPDQVQQKIKVAYRLNPASSPAEFEAIKRDIDGQFHEGLMVNGIYGQHIPGQVPEIIPDASRYYWVPILSPYASDDTLRKFEEVLLPGALIDADGWRTRLDPYYFPDGAGTAYITKVGRNYFVMHTRENLYEEQTYALPAAPAPMNDVQALREGNTVAVSWPFREGDISYTVMRALNPLNSPPQLTDFEVLAQGIDQRTYKDEAIQSSDTVVYAVSALTNEKAPTDGTVNYGDYRVISAARSPIVAGAQVRPYTIQSVPIAVAPASPSALPKEQLWWDDLRHADGNTPVIGQAISDRLLAMADAFNRGDVDALVGLYAPNYSDADGMGRGYVAKVFSSYFKNHRPGQMARQVRSWNFDDVNFSGHVRVTVYCQFTGIVQSPLNHVESTRTHTFPPNYAANVEFTFASSESGEWLITSTNPPLPRLEDVLP